MLSRGAFFHFKFNQIVRLVRVFFSGLRRWSLSIWELQNLVVAGRQRFDASFLSVLPVLAIAFTNRSQERSFLFRIFIKCGLTLYSLTIFTKGEYRTGTIGPLNRIIT